MAHVLAFIPSPVDVASMELFAFLIAAIVLVLILERYLLDRCFDYLAARARDREPRRKAQLNAIAIGRIERKS